MNNKLTEREAEVLELIRRDPLISQRALAHHLGITRSAAAGHVMSLTDKGAIRGRGYLLNDGPYVCVIGGANVDIEGRSTRALRPEDSNIGTVRTSPGGVGRNIAENLARLGTPTRLITALGTDDNGHWLHGETTAAGVDMAETMWLQGQRTATYLSTLDHRGNMVVAINDMAVLEGLEASALAERDGVIAAADAVVLDANLQADALAHMFSAHPTATFFVDTVSVVKAARLQPHLASIHTLKPNRAEAQLLSGVEITSQRSLRSAALTLLDRGVSAVAISLGRKGLLYATSESSEIVAAPLGSVASVTGAGDALMAALVHAHLAGWASGEAARFAVAAAGVATRSDRTVAVDMTNATVTQLMQTGKQAS